MVVERSSATVKRVYSANTVVHIAGFFKRIFLNLTVEPAMFLLAFANNMDNISIDQMLIYKTCRIDFGYNDTVCDNLVSENDTYEDQNTEVQNEMAQFYVYTTMASSVFPIFFAFYLGAWCDTFGRKICIFLFLFTKIISCICVILVAYFMESRKEWYLFSLIPTSLVGGFGALSMSLNAYISDISEPDQRAFRMGMLHLAMSLGRPLAPILGAYLLETGGYVCLFTTSLVLVFLSTTFMYLKFRTYHWQTEKQKKRNAFSLYHVKDALVNTFRKRPGPNRKYLLVLMTAMVFIIVPFFGEGNISYLYVRTRYDWNVKEYSEYNSIVSAAGIVGQVVIIPLVTLLNIRNSLVCMLVILSVMARHIVKAFASEPWMFYVGDFVDLIGAYSMSLIRAMITCCIPMTEFGKIYAVLTAMENLIPIGVTQVYAIVWEATSVDFPGTVFLLSASITLIPLTLATYVFFSLKGKRLSEVTEIEEIEENDEMKSKTSYQHSVFVYEEATISYI